MAAKRFAALNFSVFRNAETLCRAFVCFKFWHDLFISFHERFRQLTQPSVETAMMKTPQRIKIRLRVFTFCFNEILRNLTKT